MQSSFSSKSNTDITTPKIIFISRRQNMISFAVNLSRIISPTSSQDIFSLSNQQQMVRVTATRIITDKVVKDKIGWKRSNKPSIHKTMKEQGSFTNTSKINPSITMFISKSCPNPTSRSIFNSDIGEDRSSDLSGNFINNEFGNVQHGTYTLPQKEIIYYTHNKLDSKIMRVCQRQLLKAANGIPIISVSLKPMSFGRNIVLNLEPGIITMFKQILTALEASTAKYVFFTEHDLTYHPSHFEFTPPTDDTFYYNTNVFRWDYPKDRAITYDNLRSLSGLVCNRELAIDHYRKRLALIEKNSWKEDSKEPKWVRKIGYEPGKSTKRGGFSDDKVEDFRSEFPNIDIRHKGTQSPSKVTLESFKHKPTGWLETTLDQIQGWNLKEAFNV